MKINILFFIAITIFSCAKKQKDTTNNPILHLKIPINNIQKTYMTDFISEYIIIPLEFTEKSMIKDISKIEIHDSLIYLLDSFGARNVMVFNMDGKFIRTIGGFGWGPGQIPYPKDFIYIEEESRIDILGNKRINSFSNDGKLINENRIRFSSTNFFRQGDIYFFTASFEKNCLLLKTDQNFNKTETILEDKPKCLFGNGFKPFIKTTQSNFLHWTLMNDTIYCVSKNNAYPSRIIDFGSYKFDIMEFETLSDKEKMLTVSYQNKINQCLIKRYFETENYIQIYYYLSGKFYCFIYNKKLGTTKHFDADNLIDNIFWFDQTKELPRLVGHDNECFYYMVAPYEYKKPEKLLKFFGKSNISINERDAQFLIEETSNPILVIAKYEF